MKKIGIIVMLLVGFTTMAQKGEEGKRQDMKDLTPEQVATLQTKKATLALDLSEEQQGQMKVLLLEDTKMRKAKKEERKAQREKGEVKKRTSEERYALANERLDHQIAQKEKVKNILSDEQYAKWQKMQHRRSKGKRVKGRNGKGKNDRRQKSRRD